MRLRGICGDLETRNLGTDALNFTYLRDRVTLAMKVNAWCSIERVATGIECSGTILRSPGNSDSKMKFKMAVPNTNETGENGITPNQMYWKVSPTRKWSKHMSSTFTEYMVADIRKGS